MHHFVQSTPSNGGLPAETGALPSAPQSLLDLTMDLPHLGNPFTSPSVVKSCRLSPFSSLTLAASFPSKSMTSANDSQWVGASPPVHSLVGFPPAGLTPCPSYKQWANLIYLFAPCFKTLKTSPSLKLLLKLFLFLWKNRRPLTLWTKTNPHKRNIPP